MALLITTFVVCLFHFRFHHHLPAVVIATGVVVAVVVVSLLLLSLSPSCCCFVSPSRLVRFVSFSLRPLSLTALVWKILPHIPQQFSQSLPGCFFFFPPANYHLSISGFFRRHSLIASFLHIAHTHTLQTGALFDISEHNPLATYVDRPFMTSDTFADTPMSSSCENSHSHPDAHEHEHEHAPVHADAETDDTNLSTSASSASSSSSASSAASSGSTAVSSSASASSANPNSSSFWNIIKNPSNGRTRISQACDRCRARKIKCSGKSENNPKCTNCEKDGFPCVVSDKLTRNSFPKGYTKNLEKKLLDVELSRNQLLLELNSLKQKISTLESNGSSENNTRTTNDHSTDRNNNKDNAEAAAASSNAETNLQPSSEHQADDRGALLNTQSQPTTNEQHHSLLELQDDNIQALRRKIYYSKPVATNRSGLLVVDQNLKSPFETIFTSLKSNPFKGYNSSASFSSTKQSSGASMSSASSTTSSHAMQSSTLSNDDLDPVALKHLTNYHMNLNRYLNLILYKLIFPLFNANSNNGSDPNKNLDHLIWLFFNDYNKLIPILDFELFYNDYLTFVNTYTIKNSTYSDNGELKKRYYEFNPKDQDTMVKLILILKFTLCQPKINNNNKSSAFLPDKTSLNQLDESVKLINVKHLIMMLKNINFCLSPNLDKLEISLLLFYYLTKFENYNLPNYTDGLHSHKEFLLDVINLNKHLVNTLNINKSSTLLLINKFPEKQLIEIQRLKLYWNFKILIKLSEIYFNIPLLDEEIVSSDMKHDDEDEIMDDANSELFDEGKSATVKKSTPASLETIVLVSNDIKITLCLVKLLRLIPWNIMQFVNDGNTEVLNKIDSDLSNWKKSVETLYNEENSVVFNKLKSYYLYFKVLVNINGTIDSSYFIDFVNLVYDLTFNNPKSNSNKSEEISIEASESLCLHSFNFHLVTLISITSLQNVKDKQLCRKIYKLIQLYQILINYKDVDPLITTFVTYIKENILFAFSDANTIQDETLKLFSSVDMEKANSTSLFDKKVSHRNMRVSTSLSSQSQSQASNQNQSLMNFDLNAFNVQGDSFYMNDEPSNTKRRKSNASTTSSFMSSNLSLNSRESSVVSSSRRLSVSSNDSMPSLFPSATSPFHNNNNTNSSLFQNNNNGNNINFNENCITSSAKKRIMDYAIQPMRTTMSRSRSLSAESRIRSSKISDRRLSGSNHSAGFTTSRENSIDVNNTNLADDIVDDDIVSRILNSDVDSEVDSDVSMILTGRPTKSSNFKRNTNILPTIPSEGNLMKIMGVMETTTLDTLSPSTGESKDADFDVGSLFSVGAGMSSTAANSSDAGEFKENNALSPDSNQLKSKMSDFSKAFRKSTNGSISSAYHSSSSSKSSATLKKEPSIVSDPMNPNVINNPNLQTFTSITNDKSMIDDDDLMRLKEHVMSMKTSIH